MPNITFSLEQAQRAFVRWYQEWAHMEHARGNFFAAHMILGVSAERFVGVGHETDRTPTSPTKIRDNGTRLLQALTSLQCEDAANKIYLESRLQQSLAYLASEYFGDNAVPLRERLFYLDDAPTSFELQSSHNRLVESLHRCGFTNLDVRTAIAAARASRTDVKFEPKQRSIEIITNYLTDYLRSELGLAVPDHSFETDRSFESNFRMFVRHVETASPMIFANNKTLAPTIGFDFDSVFIHEFCGHVLHFSTLRESDRCSIARKIVIPHTDALFFVEAIAQAIANRIGVVLADQLPFVKLATDYANYRLTVSADVLARLALGELSCSEATSWHIAQLGGVPEVVEAGYTRVTDGRHWLDANTTMSYFASLKHIWKVFPPERPLHRDLFLSLLGTSMSYDELLTWTAKHA